MTEITLRDLEIGDAGWLIQRHAESYAEAEGFDASFEPLVADILVDFLRNHDPACERGWIAAEGRQRLGSIFASRALRPVRPSSGCFSSNPPRGAVDWAGGCWPPASNSRAGRGMSGCSFGPMRATGRPVRFMPSSGLTWSRAILCEVLALIWWNRFGRSIFATEPLAMRGCALYLTRQCRLSSVG